MDSHFNNPFLGDIAKQNSILAFTKINEIHPFLEQLSETTNPEVLVEKAVNLLPKLDVILTAVAKVHEAFATDNDKVVERNRGAKDVLPIIMALHEKFQKNPLFIREFTCSLSDYLKLGDIRVGDFVLKVWQFSVREEKLRLIAN